MVSLSQLPDRYNFPRYFLRYLCQTPADRTSSPINWYLHHLHLRYQLNSCYFYQKVKFLVNLINCDYDTWAILFTMVQYTNQAVRILLWRQKLHTAHGFTPFFIFTGNMAKKVWSTFMSRQVAAENAPGVNYRNFYSFLFRSFFVLNAHKRRMIENSPELLHTEPFQKCHRVPVWFSHKSYLIMYNTLVNLIVRENCFRAPFIDMVSLSYYSKIVLKIPVLCRYKFRLHFQSFLFRSFFVLEI